MNISGAVVRLRQYLEICRFLNFFLKKNSQAEVRKGVRSFRKSECSSLEKTE